MIPDDLYKKFIENLPILCVDIVIQGSNGSILLIKRNNEPLKGEWWVLGGRIQHGESAIGAAKRKVFEEVGIKLDSVEFIGYYEDEYEKNVFQNKCSYHTLSLVFMANVESEIKISLDKHHSN